MGTSFASREAEARRRLERQQLLRKVCVAIEERRAYLSTLEGKRWVVGYSDEAGCCWTVGEFERYDRANYAQRRHLVRLEDIRVDSKVVRVGDLVQAYLRNLGLI